METYAWYEQLVKPSWAPPAMLFGPVWTVLYIGIAISFGTVLFMAIRRKIRWTTALPFIINLVANIAYTPIQFGLKNNVLASIDIIIVLVSLVWAMKAIYPHAKWIAYAQVPYLLWVSFATCLQLSITYLNLG
jgi:tryptophan-rich sensory protein